MSSSAFTVPQDNVTIISVKKAHHKSLPTEVTKSVLVLDGVAMATINANHVLHVTNSSCQEKFSKSQARSMSVHDLRVTTRDESSVSSTRQASSLYREFRVFHENANESDMHLVRRMVGCAALWQER